MSLLVNGEPIDEEAVRQEAERMRPDYERAFSDEEAQSREARLLEWARENVTERVLLAQEARRDPEPVPRKEIDAAFEEMKQRYASEEEFYAQSGLTRADEPKVRADIEARLRVDRLLDRITRKLPPPSDQAVRQYYDEHQDEFLAPEQVRVSHIVKYVGADVDPATARAELAKAQEELHQGGEFADVAERHSDCPDNGGDLGWFPRGQMVEEFENVVFTLAVGQVSDIFPTRFGFHIARLHDRRPPAPYPFEQAQDHIKERLANDMRNKAIEDFIDRLREKATIREA